MILENEEYQTKSKTTCDCGYEFSAHDIEELRRINQSGFYGNAVKHYSHAKCKQCGKDVILLLKQVGQTYKVIDTACKNVIEDTQSTEENVTEDIESPIKNVKTDENNVDNHTGETNNENKDIITPKVNIYDMIFTTIFIYYSSISFA